MRIALITQVYPPLRSSGAVQMRDLAREFARQGYQPVILTPADDQHEPWTIEDDQGVEVVRLRSFTTRDRPYVVRTLNEFLMPFIMQRSLRGSPVDLSKFDAVAAYSPSIFLGPLIRAIRRASGCKAYLILRDIFPRWMLDLGLIGCDPRYHLLQAVADYEYRQVDVIGIQTPGNRAFVESRVCSGRPRVEVLVNWLSEGGQRPSSVDFSVPQLAGRKVFVYAGNMGVAQGMEKLLALAEALRDRDDIGVLFVGRGSERERIRDAVVRQGLSNVAFHDEIDPDEIPALYEQAYAGLLSLATNHKTHNIPGKFISYMHSGLPVIASVNSNNDLVDLIRQENVGRVSVDPIGADLASMVRELADDRLEREAMSRRARALARETFSAASAVRQIVAATAR